VVERSSADVEKRRKITGDATRRDKSSTTKKRRFDLKDFVGKKKITRKKEQ
jgi:hypothetical protein